MPSPPQSPRQPLSTPSALYPSLTPTPTTTGPEMLQPDTGTRKRHPSLSAAPVVSNKLGKTTEGSRGESPNGSESGTVHPGTWFSEQAGSTGVAGSLITPIFDARQSCIEHDGMMVVPSSSEPFHDNATMVFRAQAEAERGVLAIESCMVADDDGDPLAADAFGDGYQKIWRKVSILESNGELKAHRRKCQASLSVINLLTRCCSTTQLRDPTFGRRWGLLNRLGVADAALPDDTPPVSAVVGLSAITGEWVLARKPARKKQLVAAPEIDEGDNIEGDGSVIWHENMTVPGNIGAVESLIMHNDRNFDDEKSVVVAIKREHRRLTEGLPPRPLCHHRPGPEGSDWQPDLSRVYSNSDDKDQHFTLLLPPLGVLVISPEILDALKSFLWSYPMDPMSINLALQALFVYADIQKSSDLMAEGCAFDGNNMLKYPVPEVALSIFIIYWPHYIRFHEVHKLTRYMHPLRFISMQYELDTHFGGPFFSIKKNALDVTKLLRLARDATSASNAIPDSLRVPVLPHSMPGTKLIWPAGSGSAERDTNRLTALCLINDIRLCGLPCYHRRTRASQAVAVPTAMAKLVLRSPMLTVESTFVPPLPEPRFWIPESRAEVVALTGTDQFVGPFYQDLDAVPLPSGPHTANDREQSVLSIFQSHEAMARVDALTADESHSTSERELTPYQINEILEAAGPHTMEDQIRGPVRRFTPAQCTYLCNQIQQLEIQTPFWKMMTGMLSTKGPPSHEDIYNECSDLREIVRLAEEVLGALTGRNPSHEPSETLHHYIPGLTAQLCGAIPCCRDEVILSVEDWKGLEDEKFPKLALDLFDEITRILPMLGNPDANSKIGLAFSCLLESDIYMEQCDLLRSLDDIVEEDENDDWGNWL
ncbi:hypothetical protein NM208_g11309 [Fusarium decemcellulare]|uniref:Uncharacterized protein n=1 Tax=Fusarium decemcellulare TaxID=57161 RepID=A0ACC1RT46_9HYPO|nr:hypothetical protein NM208_g11309 [Fusarium decemcellulare]